MRVVSGLGTTVIAALHDLNIAAAFCDDVAVLDEGRLVAFGPPDTVLTPAFVDEAFTSPPALPSRSTPGRGR